MIRNAQTALPMEARRAIENMRSFHALMMELAQEPMAADAGKLEAIGARLHARIAESGYGIGRSRFAGSNTHADSAGEIGYVMAALADETLLRLLDWPGRDLWADKLLEERVYGTRVAGDRIYDLVESLQYRRDSERIGLAAALYLAMLLGFRGRYADNEPAGMIEQFYGELQHMAFGHRLDLKSTLLAVDLCAMAETLPPLPVRRLPSLKPWLVSAAVVMLVYLGASHLLWQQGVDSLLDRAASIRERLG